MQRQRLDIALAPQATPELWRLLVIRTMPVVLMLLVGAAPSLAYSLVAGLVPSDPALTRLESATSAAANGGWGAPIIAYLVGVV